jgi:hypothetical protein
MKSRRVSGWGMWHTHGGMRNAHLKGSDLLDVLHVDGRIT